MVRPPGRVLKRGRTTAVELQPRWFHHRVGRLRGRSQGSLDSRSDYRSGSRRRWGARHSSRLALGVILSFPSHALLRGASFAAKIKKGAEESSPSDHFISTSARETEGPSASLQ